MRCSVAWPKKNADERSPAATRTQPRYMVDSRPAATRHLLAHSVHLALTVLALCPRHAGYSSMLTA